MVRAKADFDRAKSEYPSWEAAHDAWTTFFDTPEGEKAFGRLLGDVYQRAKIEEERENGIRRFGRRPRVATSWDEVMATLFPERYTNLPFPEAFKDLLNGRSQRQFATKCGIQQSALSRLAAGSAKLDMPTLEAIAKAGKIPPSYFVEWRAMFVGKLFSDILIHYPHLGVHTLKMLRSFHK